MFEQLGIKTLEELEAAAKAHKIAPLFGFGAKTEQNILQAIEFLKSSKGRFLLGEILPIANQVLEQLQGLPEVERADIAGSVRRMKETIGDVDFLVISTHPDKVMDFFVSLPGVVKVWGQGATKSSVRLQGRLGHGPPGDPPGAATARRCNTSPAPRNTISRCGKSPSIKAISSANTASFRATQMIAAANRRRSVREVGDGLDSPGTPGGPGGDRRGPGGQAARAHRLQDIKGDLHVHCNWDGGANPSRRSSAAALALGYEYVGISDHTQFLKIEHGLDEEQLRARNQEIDEINARTCEGRPKIHRAQRLRSQYYGGRLH